MKRRSTFRGSLSLATKRHSFMVGGFGTGLGSLAAVIEASHADGDEQSHFGSPPPPSPGRQDGQPSFVATPPLPPLGGLSLNVGGGTAQRQEREEQRRKQREEEQQQHELRKQEQTETVLHTLVTHIAVAIVQCGRL